MSLISNIFKMKDDLTQNIVRNIIKYTQGNECNKTTLNTN